MNVLQADLQKIDEMAIFYFEFEQEFIIQSIQCIPMIVRYKLDTVGIKISLAQWSGFSLADRHQLSVLPCSKKNEIEQYEIFLIELLNYYGCFLITRLPAHPGGPGKPGKPPEIAESVRVILNQKLHILGKEISESQWNDLTEMERFALSKLIREDHESKNLIPALVEFGIINKE